MDTRMYPVTPEFFRDNIKPLITSCYSNAGRPASISDYHVFCAMLYVLRTGISWRDLPRCYGHWNHVYQRFKRASDRGVWWKVLYGLQKDKKVTMNVVMLDSTTFKVHRHGGGLSVGFCGAANKRQKPSRCDDQISPVCDGRWACGRGVFECGQ